MGQIEAAIEKKNDYVFVNCWVSVCIVIFFDLSFWSAQPVLCVHVCVSLSLSHRECPEACWGRQAYPRWDDSDLSPTSDFLPCSANCTVTKLDWTPVHSDQRAKEAQTSTF